MVDFSELWKGYSGIIKKGEYLIKDGIVEENQEKQNMYLNQNYKILFILKESNESGVNNFEDNSGSTGSDESVVEKAEEEPVPNESKESETDGNHKKSIYANDGWFGGYRVKGVSQKDKKTITKMVNIYRKILKIHATISQDKTEPITKEDIHKFAFININKHGNGGKTASKFFENIVIDITGNKKARKGICL